ncbi:MAG: dephospho-CoA kinase [Bacteroidales bacterium]
MMKVGLTGGIGSGKTTVAKMFIELGIPVYFADSEAKELMVNNATLVTEIKKLLGEKSYSDATTIDRVYVANQIFNNASKREMLNALIRPVIHEDFEKWSKKQNAPYVIQEAAILFETGSYKKFNKNILVVAPEQIRIERVVKRDAVSADKVNERIASQWEDRFKIKLADYIIESLDMKYTNMLVKKINNELQKLVY